MWPDVRIKCSPTFPKSCPNVGTVFFSKKVTFSKYLSYLLEKICHKYFSKIAQSGHTAWRPSSDGKSRVTRINRKWLLWCSWLANYRKTLQSKMLLHQKGENWFLTLGHPPDSGKWAFLCFNWVTFSVTRFGVISPIWQNFNCSCQYFWGSVYYLAQFSTYFHQKMLLGQFSFL